MKAEVSIDFKDMKDAKSAHTALTQETEFKKRGESEISLKEKTLTIKIEADDVVALRATLNSYLRLIQVIKGMEGIDTEGD